MKDPSIAFKLEVHEFAQRVLFATSLEEKLSAGESLTDHEPGRAISHPEAPGRPVEMRLRTDGVRAAFPKNDRLMDEEQRGILLHFFANHELLATELMALVLLKFPEAPKSFRRGIVQTLHEEQQHTLWYMRRMEECGVRFGDFALNGFFWNAIAPMATPLDYVTRLSLTFEQANLDYSRHYAQIMQAAGDPDTAKILDQIYRDEIGHVGYGLRWFRKWKEDGSSDWEAYQQNLTFPLSPSRGKGNVPFNAEGRRQAGLGDSFIRELEIYSRSKGRTPNLFVFTPDAEASMAQRLDGRGFEPRAEVKALAGDLGILPAFFAHSDDVLLLSETPSREHRHHLHSLGFVLPELETLDSSGGLMPDSLLRERKINTLRPWARCPRSANLFAPLAGNLSRPSHFDEFWNSRIRALFSKQWDHACRKLLLEHPEALPFSESDAAGFVCETADEFLAAINTLAERGELTLLGKAPFGTAGQKNFRFEANAPGKAVSWASRIIERQGAVIVEPWLDRVMDFSIHFDVIPNGELKRRGYVDLLNDRRGQFRAAISTVKFCHDTNNDVTAFLMGRHGNPGALSIYDHTVPEILSPALSAASYEGPLGIDAFVYRNRNGQLKLQPIVEINPRYTMGRLASNLRRRVEPGHSVKFELLNRAALSRAGFSDFSAFAAHLQTSFPPRISKHGRINDGTVILNDPERARQVLAILQVAKKSGELFNTDLPMPPPTASS